MEANDERRDEIFHKNMEIPTFPRLDSLAHLRQGQKWMRHKRHSENYSRFRQDKTICTIQANQSVNVLRLWIKE